MSDDRRGFLGVTAKLCGVTIAGAVGVPALGPLLHPLVADAVKFDSEETALGPVDRFPAKTPVKVPITATRRDSWTTTRNVVIGAVYVVRDDADGFLVFSNSCPHLGCAVASRGEGFNCPCHGAKFSIDGQRLGEDNPAPRDLDVMEHEVREGVLYCRFVSYEPGKATRVPTRGVG
jgi:Rieske Fe-S protein